MGEELWRQPERGGQERTAVGEGERDPIMGSSVNPDGHKALNAFPPPGMDSSGISCCARRSPPVLRGVVRRALDASSRRLLLFVDAVDAAVGALEVPEGVLHPLDARDLAKKLASRRRELR